MATGAADVSRPEQPTIPTRYPNTVSPTFICILIFSFIHYKHVCCLCCDLEGFLCGCNILYWYLYNVYSSHAKQYSMKLDCDLFLSRDRSLPARANFLRVLSLAIFSNGAESCLIVGTSMFVLSEQKMGKSLNNWQEGHILGEIYSFKILVF